MFHHQINPDILPDTPSGVSGGSNLTKITDGAVSFDGSGDYLQIGQTTDLNFGTGDFTIESFFYVSDTSNSDQALISSGAASFASGAITFKAWNTFYGNEVVVQPYDYNSGGTPIVRSGRIASNKWHHVAYTRSGNDHMLFIDGELKDTTTSSISINFNDNNYTMIGFSNLDSSNGYMDGFISNLRVIKGTALYTSDFTPPTTPLTNVTNTKLLCCQSNSSANSAAVTPGTFSNSGTTYSSNLSGAIAGSPYDATQMFDGSLSTYTDHNAQNSTITWTQTLTGVTSLKVYIHGGNSTNTVTTVGGNGTQTDTISTDFGPGWHTISLDTTGSTINSIAFARGGSGNFLSIYAVEVNGTVLIDNFYGETVARAGDAAANNFNPFITDINTVRGQETSYATLNPLNNNGGTLSDGNLSLTSSGAANVSATLQIPTTGKWYWEYFLDGLTSGGVIGIADGSAMNGTALGNWTKIYGYSPNGNKYENASASSYGATLATGDLVGVKYDADTRQLEFLKNNISQGVAYTVSSDYDYYPSIHGNIIEVITNFGQKPFKFSPPDGFQPLNTANTRPVKVISRPDQYVGVTTYTGTSDSTATVTDSENIKFTPDFVWCKSRSNAEGHALYDSVRGGENIIRSNTSEANVTNANNLKTFIPGGFTTGSNGHVYSNGLTYVSWMWKAGGNKNTFNKDDVGYATAAAAGLSGESANITIDGCSIGTKQGFSIVKYTPSSNSNFDLPHGLSQAPEFFTIKNLGGTQDWDVYVSGVTGTQQALYLNTTAALTNTGVNVWNTVDSTKINVRGASFASNTQSRIVYFWHSVPGLQKFGSYTGTGSTPHFLHLGFRPAFWMHKRTDSTGSWMMLDAARDPHNVVGNQVYANLSNAEGSGTELDFVSNGVVFRATGNDINGSGVPYVYIAFAEAPTIDLYGGGANAR